MKQVTEYLKTSTEGGMWVLLPLFLLYKSLSKAAEVIVALATPITDWFRSDTLDMIKPPSLLAFLLILAY